MNSISTPTDQSCLLTVNGGSSSIKFALFQTGGSIQRILSGRIDGVGLPHGTFAIKGSDSADNLSEAIVAKDHKEAVKLLMDWVQERIARGALSAVGHRVVHGGPKYSAPQRITRELVDELRQLSPLDPEHLPEEILLTEAFHQRFPDLPQVACFDTAFHREMPRVAWRFPGAIWTRESNATAFTDYPALTCWKNWAASLGRKRRRDALFLRTWGMARA